MCKNHGLGERFPLFLLFFQEIISEGMVFAAEILPRGSSTLGKTAEIPAVLPLFPLFVTAAPELRMQQYPHARFSWILLSQASLLYRSRG
jgi:hypothetical protein